MGYWLTADLSSLQTCMSEDFMATLFSNVLKFDSGVQGFQSDPPCQRPTASSGFWYRFTGSADVVVGPRGFAVLQTSKCCTCFVRVYSSRESLAISLKGLVISRCATPVTAYYYYHYYYYYYYYYYCLLQLSFHPVAVALTPVQTKPIRINIHKRNNTKTQYKQYKTQ
jgi:hypothetical protein